MTEVVSFLRRVGLRIVSIALSDSPIFLLGGESLGHISVFKHTKVCGTYLVEAKHKMLEGNSAQTDSTAIVEEN